MSAQGFRLPVVAGKTFRRELVTLDGTRYENCKFIECQIVYSGGPGRDVFLRVFAEYGVDAERIRKYSLAGSSAVRMAR